MLLQQTTDFLLGRHQRQNSTPTVFDKQKATFQSTHGRGLSSDLPGYAYQSHGLPQLDDHSHSVEHTLGQQLTRTAFMRETQPQTMARPGLDQEEIYHSFHHNSTSKESPRLAHGTEEFTNTNHTIPTTELDNQIQQSLQTTYRLNKMDFLQSFDSIASAGNLDGFGTGLDGHIGNIPINELMNTTPMPNGISSTANSRPTSRGRVPEPCTPPSQTITNYFPMTPATTPFSRKASIDRPTFNRTAECSPTRKDPNLTIKASQEMQRGSSCQDNFVMMRQHAMSPDVPSPPHTAPLEPRKSVDFAAFPVPNLFNMSSLNLDIPLWDENYNASNYSPESNAMSSAISSFQSSPEITHVSLFKPLDNGLGTNLVSADVSRLPPSPSAIDLGSHDSPREQGSQARSQSVSQIDPDECVEETGVTCDEIAAFISYPDDESKWTCLYPNCGKKFARKENIKAHVQTHLNDRQYRCKDCNKRFVRQHDLKRHANIHGGIRPYHCPCGKSFARQDALTRHRQRGMCIGAYEGTGKRVSKRGRPKKTRPDAADRHDKSAATRQRALERLGQYASSVSESSISTHPSPEQFDSPLEYISSPPGLDLSSSSPAAPKLTDFDVNLSQSLLMPFEASASYFQQDFDLSVPLSKNEGRKEADDAIFRDYFSQQLEGGELNDFVFDTEM